MKQNWGQSLMDNQENKSYGSKPTVHKVNVFHFHTLYRFFNISCETCKKQHKCHDIDHKREICAVAKAAEKLLVPFTIGNVSSFTSDDFYIATQENSIADSVNFKEIFKFLTMKYMKKNAR